MKKYYLAIGLVVLFSLFSFLAHYFVTSGPARDQEKLKDIALINDRISVYANSKNKLPESLNDLDLGQLKAKQNLQNYTYKNKGTSNKEGFLEYELCATFETEKKGRNNYPSEVREYVSTDSGHAKGLHCYELRTYVSVFEE